MKVRDRDYLRKTLEHTGLSYREIAALAGVSHATLANLARPDGRQGCNDSTAHSISRAVGIDVGLLFLPNVCVANAQMSEETATVQGLREGESEL